MYKDSCTNRRPNGTDQGVQKAELPRIAQALPGRSLSTYFCTAPMLLSAQQESPMPCHSTTGSCVLLLDDSHEALSSKLANTAREATRGRRMTAADHDQVWRRQTAIEGCCSPTALSALGQSEDELQRLQRGSV